MNVFATYTEPREYTKIPDIASGKDFYDLSILTEGIRPINGFINFGPGDSGDFCFVPMLGFEQARFSYMMENVQPDGRRVYPIIGLPGFRIEYPFNAYLSNQDMLLESQAWRNVRFATANCPFSAFYVLRDIQAAHAGGYLKVAPIGTKPHGLGAVLYSILNRKSVEIVYDHPLRQANRTSGSGSRLLYRISDFFTFIKEPANA
jgi:hypothetical protein